MSKEEALAARLRQAPQASAAPQPINYIAHGRGNMQLSLANNGTFGTYGQELADPFTGLNIPSCMYPKNSDLVYLWVGAFWIGAIIDDDTLVSVGTEDFYQTLEFQPEPPECDPRFQVSGFCYQSIDERNDFFSTAALSEQDLVCWYTDTFTSQSVVDPDPTDNRGHRPLNIRVRQRSMAWSYAYADDFILFDYLIENIGRETLKDVYMSIWVDGDVWHTSRNGPGGWNDDLAGFYRHHPAPEGCGFTDTVNIAYHADNDGDPAGGVWDYRSTRSAVGARVVRTPAESLKYSYNWWIINYSDPRLDFGPRKAPTPGDPFRNMLGRLGTPLGDPNKYYVMSRPEFDYDLLYTAVDHSDSGWLRPPANAVDVAEGFDSRYLLSFGPFTVEPGQQLPISFAWVGGDNFHQEPDDFDKYFYAYSPDQYYQRLNFDNLALNARWAAWVYDNPGVDTDGDGYAGKFRVCVRDSVIERIDTSYTGSDTLIDTLFRGVVADTFFYEGDNAPDFRGAGPPPSPYVRIIPQQGKLTVRWNGYKSENTKDIFLGEVDFEGYRVYLGLDDRPGAMSPLASYDREDYNRFYLKRLSAGSYEWVLTEIPFTLDSLRAMFGNSLFDPKAYSRANPFSFLDSLFYFEPQDYNASELGLPGGIRRAYPGAVRPPADSTLWTEEMVTREHGVVLPKYYEYELEIDQLLPTIPYYISVTAFDFGSPQSGLLSLESSPYNDLVIEYPQTSSEAVEFENLDAYVYPNPYRIDAEYASGGYENREGIDPERARRIHFSNLPRVCTISIYSLDGDLVRRWDHNFESGDPGSMHDSWDLITRNTQAVVSGIYYWVVESPTRTQIGKLVIIK
ncbi:MAG: hypothetical protein NDJ18_00275 [candidate division Zixibacteria bacterium]|nr:hypothetical protein [candidate division Zixibacteria bacterium]